MHLDVLFDLFSPNHQKSEKSQKTCFGQPSILRLPEDPHLSVVDSEGTGAETLHC